MYLCAIYDLDVIVFDHAVGTRRLEPSPNAHLSLTLRLAWVDTGQLPEAAFLSFLVGLIS